MTDTPNRVSVDIELRNQASAEIRSLIALLGTLSPVAKGASVGVDSLDASVRKIGIDADKAESGVVDLGDAARKVGKDAKAAETGLDALAREAADLGAGAAVAETGLDRLGREALELGAGARQTTTGLDALAREALSLGAEARAAETAVDRLTRETFELGSGARQAGTGIDALVREALNLGAGMRRAAIDADRAGDEVVRAGRDAGQGATLLQLLSRAAREAGVAATDLGARLRRAGDDARTLGRDARQAQTATDSLSTALGRGSKSLLAYGAAAVGIGATLARVRRGTEDYLEFGRGIAEVDTILTEGNLTLEDAREKILAISAAFGENESVLAKGFYQTLSSGITDAADALVVFEQANKLAIAGSAETAKTVDVLTSIINAYGKSVSEAEAVSDVLFKTVEIGKSEIPELAASLGSIIPLAAELGVSIEEVGAGIAVLTAQGAPTSEAITRIASLLFALLERADETDAAVRRVGSSFDSTTLRTRGLLPVLRDLAAAFAGNEGEIQNLLGRREAVLGFLGLTEAGANKLEQALAGTRSAAGATALALDKQLGSSARRFQIIANGLRLGFLDLGGSIVEGLVGASDSFGGATDAAERLRAAVTGLETPIKLAAVAAGSLAVGFASAANAAATLANIVGKEFGFDLVSDETAKRLNDDFILLTELNRALITGEQDFTGTAEILGKRRREARAKEQAEARADIKKTAAELASAISAGQRDETSIGFNLDVDQFGEKIDKLVSRARKAGLDFAQVFNEGLQQSGGPDLDAVERQFQNSGISIKARIEADPAALQRDLDAAVGAAQAPELVVTASLGIEKLEQDIARAKVEIAALSEEVEAGEAKPEALILRRLELRRLEFRLIGLQEEAVSGLAERGEAAVTRQIEAQIEALRRAEIESGARQAQTERIRERAEAAGASFASWALGIARAVVPLALAAQEAKNVADATERARDAQDEYRRALGAGELGFFESLQGGFAAAQEGFTTLGDLGREFGAGAVGAIGEISRALVTSGADFDAVSQRIITGFAEMVVQFGLLKAVSTIFPELANAGTGIGTGIGAAATQLGASATLTQAAGTAITTGATGLTTAAGSVTAAATAISIAAAKLAAAGVAAGAGSIAGSIGGGTSSAVSGALSATSAAAAAIPGGTFGFEEGGIMTPRGPLTLRRALETGAIPIRTYESGGVARRPQAAIFGEGSRPEAYVPLEDGRTIPVTVTLREPPGARGGGGLGVSRADSFLTRASSSTFNSSTVYGGNSITVEMNTTIDARGSSQRPADLERVVSDAISRSVPEIQRKLADNLNKGRARGVAGAVRKASRGR